MPKVLSSKRCDAPAPSTKVTRWLRSWPVVLTLAAPALVWAHFQELIPSSESLSAETGNRVALELPLTGSREAG